MSVHQARKNKVIKYYVNNQISIFFFIITKMLFSILCIYLIINLKRYKQLTC